MPKIYRALARETLAIFFATLLILLAIILSFRLSNLLASAGRGDIALGAVAQLIAMQALRFLILLAPLSFVLAAMMALGRMHQDLEISALLASGIGYGHQLRALLLTAFPLCLGLLYLQLFVLPQVYRSQEALQQRAQQQVAVVLFQPRSFRSFGDGSTIYIDKISQNQLQDFFLKRGDELILAQRGRLEISGQMRSFYLENGRRIFLGEELQSYGNFQRAELNIPLEQQVLSNKLRNIPTAELDHSPAQRAELQLRLNGALALFIFVFFIPLLARSKVRGGKYQKVLPAFLLFALYYNLLEFLVSQMKKGKLTLWAGAYLHVAVLMAAYAYWQMSTRRPARA